MTDYLELLLEEQREDREEREWAWVWREGPGPLPQEELPAQARPDARAGPGGGESGDGMEDGERGEGGLLTLPGGEVPRGEIGLRRWMAGEKTLPEAGVREAEGWTLPSGGGIKAALWADRAVRRSLEAAAGPVSAPLRPAPAAWTERPGAEGLEAERLDRLFRRDARRFDGGFQLL